MTVSLLRVSGKYRYKRCDLDLEVCNRQRFKNKKDLELILDITRFDQTC